MWQSCLPAVVSPAPKCLSSSCHYTHQAALFVLGIVQCSGSPLRRENITPNRLSSEQIIVGKVQGAGDTINNSDLLNCAAWHLSCSRHKARWAGLNCLDFWVSHRTQALPGPPAAGTRRVGPWYCWWGVRNSPTGGAEATHQEGPCWFLPGRMSREFGILGGLESLGC